MDPGFRLIGDPTIAQIDAVCRLRVEAWRGQAQVFAGVTEWRDRWDDVAQHRLLIDPDGQIAGALRFSLHDNLVDLPDGGVWAAGVGRLPRPLAYFSRMFVVPAWRGRGLSITLDRASLAEPQRQGAASVVCMTGSVGRNRERAKRMKDFGWTLIGQASAQNPEAMFHATHLPLVFAARFDGQPVSAA